MVKRTRVHLPRQDKVSIGVDPGLSGAVVVYDISKNEITDLTDMPVFKVKRGKKNKREIDELALARFFRSVSEGGERLISVFVERVGAMKGQGVTSMFSFGQGYGVIRGIIVALELPRSFVEPVTWRKALKVRKGKDGSRMRASELIPSGAHYWQEEKQHGRADAALIAYYGAHYG